MWSRPLLFDHVCRAPAASTCTHSAPRSRVHGYTVAHASAPSYPNPNTVAHASAPSAMLATIDEPPVFGMCT